MEKIIRNLESYAPSVLRIGMSAVMLWFSFEQFLHTSQWTAYVPDSAVSITGLSAMTLVYFNALFELAFGVLMLFGIQTRVAAFLLAIHLFDIMYVVGYGEIGVRDLGLAIATLVVAMNGPDRLSIDQRINNQNII
jgi:uncharacterized membrane protein YphA (DoxX/SURF4 family)